MHVHGVTLPLRSPLVTARGVHESRSTLLVALADGNHVGWGEAAPLPGWSTESIEECHAALTAVSGLDPAAGLDGLRQVPAARAALHGAIHDLDAKRLGISLRDHLAASFGSGPAARRVTVNGLVTAPDPDAAGAAARRLAGAGVTTVKVKVAAVAPEVDLARVAAVRAGLPGAIVRLDANGGWDADTARRVLGVLADHDISLCEEPVAGLDAILGLAADSPIPLAVDESARTPADIDRALDGGIGAIVLKPQALGGADIAMAAVARIRAVGAIAIVTSMFDSGVGVAHAAHAAAAIGGDDAHGLDTARLLAADVAATSSALPITDGRLRFAADADPVVWGPGLGLGPVSPDLGGPS